MKESWQHTMTYFTKAGGMTLRHFLAFDLCQQQTTPCDTLTDAVGTLSTVCAHLPVSLLSNLQWPIPGKCRPCAASMSSPHKRDYHSLPHTIELHATFFFIRCIAGLHLFIHRQVRDQIRVSIQPIPLPHRGRRAAFWLIMKFWTADKCNLALRDRTR